MYSKLSAHVKIDRQHISESFLCNLGTRQGDLNSPIIFSLYINDLIAYIRGKCQNGIFITNEIHDIFCLLYADDVANCAETAVDLKLQLKYSSFPLFPVAYPFRIATHYNITSSARNVR